MGRRVCISKRARPPGVQIARFPDTRGQFALPTPDPLFSAISRTNVPCSDRNQGYGREGLFEYEYRVARTEEVGEKAFPVEAVGGYSTFDTDSAM